MNKETENQNSPTSKAIEVPSIALPKGGGAIKGIDEKFSVNAVNGTASFAIPLPFSQSRGFTPSLGLSYDSGGGNGVFGLGWSLGLSSIKRKTDKELPKYLDSIDSDVFLFSEAEDLVPEYTKDNNGNNLIHKKNSSDNKYTIKFYKPRIEGLFARIERWTNKTNGEIKWRVISKENVTTLFGWTDQSRLSDPLDQNRLFEWFPEFVFDDKGNCSHYIYKKEDAKGYISSLLHNRNRRIDGTLSYTNLYLEKVLYGNKTSYNKNYNEDFPSEKDYMFQTVFDYGEYDTEAPYKKKNNQDWNFREDPFSNYKAGFEIRTTRLCKRVILYHFFDELPGGSALVKSLNFEYDQKAVQDFTFLESMTEYGYIKQDDGTYIHHNLPPIDFKYQQHEWNTEVKTIASEDLVHSPSGLDEPLYQFVDLYNEGLPGILTEQAGAWYFKHNLGNGKFAQAKRVTPKPSLEGLGSQLQLMDLDADGTKQLVNLNTEPKVYYDLTDEESWQSCKAFKNLPNIDINDPNTRLLDLNGDGKADLLISEDNVFVWYQSLGRKGYSVAHKTPHPFDEERGPYIIFSDATESIFLADMSGDGLTDIVRIRNGEICYWPNLGYGKFAAKVGMDNAPLFDHPNAFNPAYLRIADIDGSGTPDIIYLGKDRFTCWMNLSGNSFAKKPFEISAFPKIDNEARITVTDLLGNGIACIVWSSHLQKDTQAPLKYIDLMSSKKPHIMTAYKNNLGKEVSFEYVASTKFYSADKLAGTPWVTKLHFPVHVVDKIIVTDKWGKTHFSTSYSYHHGYYDHHEREFRGFGRVEQVDVETFGGFAAGNSASPYISDDKTLYQPPVKTVTWFHTGAFLERERSLTQFKEEYFPAWLEAKDPETKNILGDFSENDLPEPDLMQQDLTAQEWQEALRACKGMTLRQEVYELDVDALKNGEQKPVKLFTTAYHNANIQCLQPQLTNRHAVFLVTESEAITYHYELDLQQQKLTPDPRIEHTLDLNIDPYGNVRQALAVVYPRIQQHEDNSLPEGTEELIAQVQKERHLAYTEIRYTNDVNDDDKLRLRMPCETLSYEVTGIEPDSFYFTLDELRRYRLSDKYQTGSKSVESIEYHKLAKDNECQKRLIEHSRILYFNKNLKDPLPLGKLNYLGLSYETYTLALTDDLLTAVFGKRIKDVQDDLKDETKSGYLSGNDLTLHFPNDANITHQYWIRSGIAGFADDAAEHFYLPERYTDPFGNVTTLQYDVKDLYIQSSTDPVGNRVSITQFDFRLLAPREMQDINDNLTEVVFDVLGMPTAMAVKGKGDEADTLVDFNSNPKLTNPTLTERKDFFTQAYDGQKVVELIGKATARYIYDFGEQVAADGSVASYGHRPAGAATILREQHAAQLEDSPLQLAFEYSDGSGNVLVKKAPAEPEKGSTQLRWTTSGKTILNNKGKPVKQYEPYFSESEHHFEEPQEVGVTPVIYYDALDREVCTLFPDGSFSRDEYTPWHVVSYDQNDTVLESGHDWYDKNTKGSKEEKRAAKLTKLHADTPSTVFLDSLGRDVISIEHNCFVDEAENMQDQKYVTYTKLDAEGKPLWIRDARANLVMQYITPPVPNNQLDNPVKGFTPCYDIAGNLLFQHSMDSGDRWLINDAAGKPFYAWDKNERVQDDGTLVEEQRITRIAYDGLHRPLLQELNFEQQGWQVTERFKYGEDKIKNLRGQLYQHYDPSGRVMQVIFDFKGNLLEQQKQLINDPKVEWVHWSGSHLEQALNPEIFYKYSEYDALNRISREYNWHTDPDRVAVYEPQYNERGMLKSENLTVTGGKKPTPVSKITYDAKGQRQSIRHGNGTLTRYFYDPSTFRLKQLRTTRNNYDPPFPGYHSSLTNLNVLQQLSYTYDPVGNITEIYDEAYEPVFFKNQEVKPHSCYQYDALYRLMKAEGRESAASNAAPGQFEKKPIGVDFQVTDNTLRKYTQLYSYDEVGNIKQMNHVANGGSWTRHYEFAEESNRLLSTWIGNNRQDAISYDYDTHGSMLNLAKATDKQAIYWDHRDMIHKAKLNNGGWAYYNYDTEKQRTRKYIEYKDGKIEERIYLDGMEVYRRWDSNNQLLEKIETHHLFVDEQRVLMVEDVISTDNNKLSAGILYRYQYSNHLGSVALELDDGAKIISYEEYHPYGTSAYRMTNNAREVSPKRHRYTGMERDDETGLNYHGARYYAVWLGRWITVDPAGMTDGTNLYVYVHNNTIIKRDPTGNDSVFGSHLKKQYSTLEGVKKVEKNAKLYGLIGGMGFALIVALLTFKAWGPPLTGYVATNRDKVLTMGTIAYGLVAPPGAPDMPGLYDDSVRMSSKFAKTYYSKGKNIILELFHGTSKLVGKLSASKNEGTPSDLGKGFYAGIKEVAKLYESGRGKNKIKGIIAGFKINMKKLGNILDLREGGGHYKDFEKFLETTKENGFKTWKEILDLPKGIEMRGEAVEAFIEFLKKRGLPEPDTIIGTLGGKYSTGITLSEKTVQIVIRKQKVVDKLKP